MEIKIERRWRKAAYTIGRLYVDGDYLCETLEDTDRGLKSDMSEEEIKRIKVKGATAIPTGRYKVEITYSPRFKKQMPLVLNVKGFDGIRIHPGNTAKDTEGCILPGRNTVKGMVTNSRYWYNILYSKIRNAVNAGKEVVLVINL